MLTCGIPLHVGGALSEADLVQHVQLGKVKSSLAMSLCSTSVPNDLVEFGDYVENTCPWHM